MLKEGNVKIGTSMIEKLAIAYHLSLSVWA